MAVRIDTWLKVARIFKTRTQAARACRSGRVTVNGQPAKSHRLLSPGDRIELVQHQWKRILIVAELRNRPIPKAQARTLYEDKSPPRPKRDPVTDLLKQPSMVREKGKGRPTKRERRQMRQTRITDWGDTD